MMSSKSRRRALMSIRSALILVQAVLTGIGVVTLLLFEGATLAAALGRMPVPERGR
jgi:hypothetical protein